MHLTLCFWRRLSHLRRFSPYRYALSGNHQHTPRREYRSSAYPEKKRSERPSNFCVAEATLVANRRDDERTRHSCRFFHIVKKWPHAVTVYLLRLGLIWGRGAWLRSRPSVTAGRRGGAAPLDLYPRTHCNRFSGSVNPASCGNIRTILKTLAAQ